MPKKLLIVIDQSEIAQELEKQSRAFVVNRICLFSKQPLCPAITAGSVDLIYLFPIHLCIVVVPLFRSHVAQKCKTIFQGFFCGYCCFCLNFCAGLLLASLFVAVSLVRYHLL